MKREKILHLLRLLRDDSKLRKEFSQLLTDLLDLRENPFHPLVFIFGEPEIGKNVNIGLMSEIYAKGARVSIGDNCDIASFVSINVADSHKFSIGLSDAVERKPIELEHNVFVGSHCFIKGGAKIGHHSVIAAGTVVDGVEIPPYSFVFGNPMKIKRNYYKQHKKS